MSSVCVCITVHGDEKYFRSARQAALSVLQYSEFQVVLAVGDGPQGILPSHRRISRYSVPGPAAESHRAKRFLHKFKALSVCLERNQADLIVLLDSDAVFTAEISRDQLLVALEENSLGMVEQKGIQGTDMTQADFLNHYREHTLRWFGFSDLNAPSLEDFRYFNSGVVIARRSLLERLVPWAQENILLARSDHQIGEHMIADQDYFQFWCNSLHPGDCITLPWKWNHCEYWDNGFPRAGALIQHFSNFCLGPGRLLPLRMNLARRGGYLARGMERLLTGCSRYYHRAGS